MGVIGYRKLFASDNFGAAFWARWFSQWGYPHWFLVVVGVLELGGGLLLLFPRIAPYAAMVLGVVMLGATVTTVVHAHDVLAPGLKASDFGPAASTYHLVLLTIILVARRRNLRFLPAS